MKTYIDRKEIVLMDGEYCKFIAYIQVFEEHEYLGRYIDYQLEKLVVQTKSGVTNITGQLTDDQRVELCQEINEYLKEEF